MRLTTLHGVRIAARRSAEAGHVRSRDGHGAVGAFKQLLMVHSSLPALPGLWGGRPRQRTAPWPAWSSGTIKVLMLFAPLFALAAAGPPAPQIYSLAWRPDGAMLALGGYKEVRLIDAQRKPIATLEGHAEAVRAVAFSRDGKLLAAAGGLPARKGEVKLWDVGARTVAATLTGHSDCIYAAAFSPDGAMLATASYDKLIKLWDVATGKEIRTLKDHIDAVYDLAFTPDGKRLVSGSADRSVKIWDVATGARLYTLSEPSDGINAIALSPDGTRVAAGGFDKTIRIWHLGEKEGKLENSLIAHEDTILKLAWSPDGEYLASSAADRTLKIFRAADLSEIRAIANLPDWAFGLQFAPGAAHQTLAAGFFNGRLETYEVDHAKTLAAK